MNPLPDESSAEPRSGTRNGMAPPFWVRCLRFRSMDRLRSVRMLKLREYVEIKLRVAGSSFTAGFRWTFSATFAIARITPSGLADKIALVILLSGESEKNLTVCFTFFNSLRAFFDCDWLISSTIKSNLEMLIAVFYTQFFYRSTPWADLSEKYLSGIKIWDRNAGYCQ